MRALYAAVGDSFPASKTLTPSLTAMSAVELVSDVKGLAVNTRTMSHSSDPTTSFEAADTVDTHKSMLLKLALIDLLEEDPRNGDELTDAYYNLADVNGWPVFSDHHNPKRRLSELHQRHHVIRESGVRRPSRLGKLATVWELSVSADEAREVVKAS